MGILRQNRENQHGFTNVELLIALVLIFLYAGLAIPSLMTSFDEAREQEVKNNLHLIQVAIERYEVDQNRYPSFLLGGDNTGWREWHRKNDEVDPPKETPSNNLVVDILIQYGYLESYPKNPFVDDGMKIIKSTCAYGSGEGGKHENGNGDPRFGFYGDTMGNGLSDPSYYIHRPFVGFPPIETPYIETSRTLSENTVKALGFFEPPEGVHYMMGGRKAFDEKGNVITVATWWPGNFFYRGLFDFPKCRVRWFIPGAIPGGTKMNRYILGVYGSINTPGLDFIRLEGRNWDNTDDVYYLLPSPWKKYSRINGIKCGWDVDGADMSSIGMGLPEVCGGGDAFTGPVYPYNRGDEDEGYSYGRYIYGAPDGHPDGVILILTSEGHARSWNNELY